MKIDLFCSVIDNFGDAGVSWRLARALADAGAFSVRLWIDDPHCLASFVHDLDPSAPVQTCESVEVRRWQDLEGFMPGDVVIEAFGCRLPDVALAQMAQRSPPPVWINLEYLATEAWADDCHGLPSPHPSLPLQKYFFFPGFSGRTGGLIREPGLPEARERFLSSDRAQASFAAQLGLGHATDALHVSLFCYPDSPIASLIAAWRSDERPVVCLVPQTVATANRGVFGDVVQAPGGVLRDGALTVRVIPFVSQLDYDRLLWRCDLNFVRGEDSFVRAQWAGRPFVWQAYRQAANAHHDKVEAFLERYLAGVPEAESAIQRRLFEWWNGMVDEMPSWPAVRAALPGIGDHTRRWGDALALHPDLVDRLASFIKSKLK